MSGPFCFLRAAQLLFETAQSVRYSHELVASEHAAQMTARHS